ncbi:beta-ketoacyl-ACP synthase III [Actinacidiphila acididurans]|uniref:Beta-ketoacyl-[acyl-carrier-protein] synthase III n=1 Tax=Actinacidiphila acididurans TaxID=2784346 RepID=A0ABS2TXC5_9ACTN|nr:beta-ketoacyl-ACP synthase III [Actinacidiphila acididurans]MBM9507146.1 ketoacyl-ACP synthase III [Actinacidiphila acididurans]
MSAPVPVLRSSSGPAHARILAVGGYRPSRVVSNDEVAEPINSSDKWIRERSGIAERRWADPHETITAMGVAAAGKALAGAGIAADRIGCVIVATSTHFRQLPAAAAEIAHKVGAHKASAFDISAACAGFTHGLALAGDMVRSGSAEYVLLVGTERMSDLIDREDRGTAFLFGDGAGAVVVGPSATAGIGPVVWGADGSQTAAIDQSASWLDLRDNPPERFPALTMQGQTVFRWAVYQMAEAAGQALDASGLTADQLTAFIPHQANLRIVDALTKALKLPAHVAVAQDVVHSGNTSAASIPLAMEKVLELGQARSGGFALTLGFGAGLSYAGQVVALP